MRCTMAWQPARPASRRLPATRGSSWLRYATSAPLRLRSRRGCFRWRRPRRRPRAVDCTSCGSKWDPLRPYLRLLFVRLHWDDNWRDFVLNWNRYSSSWVSSSRHSTSAGCRRTCRQFAWRLSRRCLFKRTYTAVRKTVLVSVWL